MKKMNVLSALLFAGILAFCGATKVFAWGSASGDASDYRQIQETAIFFNNSGSTLVAGDVVILDTYRAGVSTGSTLGAYVTLSDGAASAKADSILAVGVVLSTSIADQRPVAVVTKGPALTECDDSSDAVTNRTAVGTSGLDAGNCGGGTNLGISLEAGDGTDGDDLIIWVAPTGAD
mgnify:CR=1 FL=1